MKQHFQLHRSSPLTPALRALAMVLGLILIAVLISGLDVAPTHAQEPDDPLSGFGPFDAPSAFGVMYLLQQTGLFPEPGPAPALSIGALGLAGSGGPATYVGGAPAGPPGVDVVANNPADDTPENTTQSETTLAVLGNTICAGYNNSGPGGFSGLSRSTDLGANWTDLGGIGQRGDPVLAVHAATGNFYYAEIATISAQPAIGVAISTDDCQSFGAAVNASPGASGIGTTTLNDKPWIAVDNTGGARDGNIYVCWTRFDSANPSELRFTRSIDGGATYVNEQILAPGGTAPFGCSVGVGSNGDVYVAWADRTGGTANDIRFLRSTTGGVSFGAAVTVSTGNRHPGTDLIVACDVNRTTLNGNIRMLHQAWLAVDTTGGPFDGNIYVVWASDPVGATDNSDVFFSRSTNGGVNWSASVQIGAGGGATDQFEPFVAVGGGGAVSIAWYDRRNDVANNNLIDVYKVFSRDGGLTFDPIIRVTDVNFPVPPINPNFDPAVALCYMGEYIAVAGDANNFYYLWGDNRNTLVTTAFPLGRPDPDVFFDSQPAPAVFQADLEVTDVRVDGPGGDITVAFPVTVDVDVHNIGPFDPANADVTATLTGVPADCTIDPVGSQTTDDQSLAVSATVTVPFTWQATCTDPSFHTFDAEGLVTLDQIFTEDPVSGNNSDTGTETKEVFAEADVAALGKDISGVPQAIAVSEQADFTVVEELHNFGPWNPNGTVVTAVWETLSPPPDCQISFHVSQAFRDLVTELEITFGGVPVAVDPIPVSSEFEAPLGVPLDVHFKVDLPVSESLLVPEDWDIHCTQPSFHDFEFVKDVMVMDGPHVVDPDPDNNHLEVPFTVEALDIRVEKNYRFTNVCFERDNDRDGLFSEDPVDGINNDGDGLVDEDPIDCPGGTDLGTPLPTDGSGNFVVKAVTNKKGKVTSYNPGQYYAVSTIEVLHGLDELWISELYGDCTEGAAPLSALNPKMGKGGGNVVLVEVIGGVAFQIADSNSPNVTVTDTIPAVGNGIPDNAEAHLDDVPAGSTFLLYVKFGPGLKRLQFPGGEPTCENTNVGEGMRLDGTVVRDASASLIVKEKE